MTEKDRPAAGKKKPRQKKVTAGYLERAALHYLGRFASSEANLRAVLIRKVKRRNPDFAAPSDEQAGWISDVVAKCVRYGYVDDKNYSAQRAEAMLRRGKPLRAIRADLKHKGIEEAVIAEAIDGLTETEGADADRVAAAAYVKRRRFGALRRPVDDAEALQKKQEKELASLARAGFGYQLSKEVLAMSAEELNELLV